MTTGSRMQPRAQPIGQPAVSEVPVLIPAYKPGAPLLAFVEELLRRRLQPIVIVNDGSGPEFASLFHSLQRPGVFVIDHPVNQGKGAALKTGMNFARTHFPGSMGVVTADADGQHDPADTARVISKLRDNPDALVMGVRQFDHGLARVPWKSRIGNGATRVCLALLAGQKLTDTQSGLRGIPASFIPHLLAIPSQRYEFELDMLMASKHHACRIVEEPIRTIYIDGNQSSHFRPFVDSMRIYFQLLRFSLLSAVTALLDNLIFVLAFTHTGSVALSQTAGRLCAMSFNYWGARRAVFHSHEANRKVLPKYVALVAVNGLLSYALLLWLHAHWGLREITAKLSAESFLFLVNFIVQRDFVFTRRKTSAAATDWDHYYARVPATAKLTRKYTTRVLLEAIQTYVAPLAGQRELSVVEIGGANSCFLDHILATFPCAAYHVVDTNSFGLSLLKDKQEQNPAIHPRRHRCGERDDGEEHNFGDALEDLIECHQCDGAGNLSRVDVALHDVVDAQEAV